MDTEKQDKLYADEPWAKLALLAGYRPYDTESSARGAFRFMEDMFLLLQEIYDLGVDGDGDVLLFADEYCFNDLRYRIGRFLKIQDPLNIEVFPMTEEGGLAEIYDEVHSWDILLRFDGGDPLREFEGLTSAQRDATIAKLQTRYPFAVLDWGPTDLLQ